MAGSDAIDGPTDTSSRPQRTRRHGHEVSLGTSTAGSSSRSSRGMVARGEDGHLSVSMHHPPTAPQSPMLAGV